jgi:uncharacterized membrane protein
VSSDANGRPQTIRGWFAHAADHARYLVREHVEALAAEVAQAAHEEFERVINKAEGRLRRGAVYAGALAAGVGLIVVAVAGAVGELLGHVWLGQLIVGLSVVVVAIIWLALARRAAKRKAEQEAVQAAAAKAVRGTEHPTVASAGAAGWLAGLLLGRRSSGE